MRMRIAPSSSYAAALRDEPSRFVLRTLHDVELERRVTVPLDAEPAQRALDLLDRLRDLAARVGVLDPQQALAALATREEPVEEKGAHAPDVEEPGGRRRHANADRHERSSVVACSSAPMSPPPEASRRRSTGSRRSAETPSRSSRRARGCGGRRRTHRRRSRASASVAGRHESRPCRATPSTS